MSDVLRCFVVVRTGLPDDVRCDKPAVYTVGRAASPDPRPVCQRHLIKEVTFIAGFGDVIVKRVSR